MNDLAPNFSPDDQKIVFSSRGPRPGLWVKNADGVTAETPLATTDKGGHEPNDWSPDGRFILYSLWKLEQQWDLVIYSIAEDKSIPFANSPFHEQKGKFSPDSRWIAYTSNENGNDEIYVRSFSAGSGKWQISTAGGDMPQWRRDGKELFYYAPDKTLMAVELRTKPDGRFEAGLPKALFKIRLRWGIGGSYCPTADGQHFLANVVTENPEPPITMVQNWTALLPQ